jgi:hypothetical protein
LRALQKLEKQQESRQPSWKGSLRKVMQHPKVRDHYRDDTWDVSLGFASLEAEFNVG